MKPIGSEHLKFDDKGHLLGLYTISGEKARELYGESRFWEGVEHIVQDYMRVNPGEINFTREENKTYRQQNNNEFGSNQTGSFRHALSLPAGLFNSLIEYEPKFFSEKKYIHKFMKLYPVFRACETS